MPKKSSVPLTQNFLDEKFWGEAELSVRGAVRLPKPFPQISIFSPFINNGAEF